jgi:septum formation protein
VSAPGLVLASGSASRQAMLRAAGIGFEVLVPQVDEDSARESLLAEGADAAAVAEALAELKATHISIRVPERLVLGADQVLVCEGRLFSKANSPEGARDVLKALRGKPHRLVSAAVMARGGVPLWRAVDSAELWVRDFSDAFLEHYLARAGEAILGSVGCYHIEGEGVQLFARVSGDQFTIRGLPLLPLLAALRDNGVVEP